jgi:hypothetical protein
VTEQTLWAGITNDQKYSLLVLFLSQARMSFKKDPKEFYRLWRMDLTQEETDHFMKNALLYATIFCPEYLFLINIETMRKVNEILYEYIALFFLVCLDIELDSLYSKDEDLDEEASVYDNLERSCKEKESGGSSLQVLTFEPIRSGDTRKECTTQEEGDN